MHNALIAFRMRGCIHTVTASFQKKMSIDNFIENDFFNSSFLRCILKCNSTLKIFFNCFSFFYCNLYIIGDMRPIIFNYLFIEKITIQSKTMKLNVIFVVNIAVSILSKHFIVLIFRP